MCLTNSETSGATAEGLWELELLVIKKRISHKRFVPQTICMCIFLNIVKLQNRFFFFFFNIPIRVCLHAIFYVDNLYFLSIFVKITSAYEYTQR